MDQEQNKTSQEEKEYASQLKQSLKIARTGVGLTNYRGSKGYQAMGMAATGADAFKEGRGLKGATKDIAISEVKRRITRSVLKKLGLEAIATEINTVEQGVQLGFHLREEINEGKFKNFIIVLILSLVRPQMVLEKFI
ncbi:hypothetical protein HY797_02315 [Candidatus Falkowbacteria bacterium]|nr:hypothetical protein [Candidatus Falkowbacteria bacterium]